MNEKLIAAALGDEPADLILTNANIINVFTGEILHGNVAVYNGKIAGIGDYRNARETLDLKGRFLAPGLIDGHVHLESSMLSVEQYARAVVPHGTTAIVTDLHEIANVCGVKGIKHVLNAAHDLPLDIFLMAPSGVPATNLETSGAVLGKTELAHILKWKNCIGLGEVMNYPGVIKRDNDVLDKLLLCREKRADGHAPGLRGRELSAYISAGILSDHESVLLEEALEKLENGMHIMIREGSSEKNLDALLPLVNDKTSRRCMFVVDDRSCSDLLKEGEVDAVVRKAINRGFDPVRAIQMATINPAEYFRLPGLGGIAPGYQANMIAIEDLASFDIDMVFYEGELVAEKGRSLLPERRHRAHTLSGTMHIKPFCLEALRMPATGETELVIGIVPGQIITDKLRKKVKQVDGFVVSDTGRDILKLAVFERHKATGNIGLGLVRGFGMKRGALASSVAHDSHNIVAVGVGDEDTLVAVKEIEKMQGGLIAVSDGNVLASLALPDAGLLSDEPLEIVSSKMENLEQASHELGSDLPAPFSALSFLALPVIPALRLTDLGMVEV